MNGRDGDALSDDREAGIVVTSQGTLGDSGNLRGGGTRTPGAPKNKHGNKSLSPSPGSLRRRFRLPRTRSGSVGALSPLRSVGSSGGGSLAELAPAVVIRSFKPDLATDYDSGEDDTTDPGHATHSSSDWSSSCIEAGGKKGKKAPRGPSRVMEHIKRKFKGKTIGGSGSMTIGRATLAGGRGGGLVSSPRLDFYGRGVDELPPRSASPARDIPMEWSNSIPSTAGLTPSEASSAGLSPLPPRHGNQQPHRRRQSSPDNPSSMVRGVGAAEATTGLLVQSSSGQRNRVGQQQYWRRQSSTDESAAMVRGRSAPAATTSYASKSLAENQSRVVKQPQKVEGADNTSGLGQADEAEANGRGRSRVGGERGGRRGSLSPARRLMAGLNAAAAAAAAAVTASGAKEREKSVSPNRGDGESVPGGSIPDSTSEQPAVSGQAGAMSGGTDDAPPERRGSRQSVQGYSDCVVEPAPPSTVKYGDRLRLWAKFASTESGSMSQEGVTPSGGGGGYVGSLDKVMRVQQRLFRRSESAVINLSGGTVSGFIDCHFKVVDPEGKRGKGDDVNLGDAVLLVDDRDYVWSCSTKGSATPIRMKLRDSAKHHIPVSFRPAYGGSTDAPKDTPMVFGPDALKIVPVDQGIKESRRRRLSSRKSHSLTAYSKRQSSGSFRASMAMLCADGRGEPVVFVPHLPNASPAGDPSPVVTKVIINANELEVRRQHQHEHQRRRSSVVVQEDREEGRSEASSAYLSGLSIISGGDEGEHRSNPSGGSIAAGEEDGLVRPPRTELQHQREGSGRSSGNCSGYSANSNIVGGSGSARDADDAVSQGAALLSPGAIRKVGFSPHRSRSPVGAEEEEEEEEEDEDDDDDVDDVDDVDDDALVEGGERFGSIEGLKWGEFVQFKLPGEGEVSPEDAMVTLILSNGCSASLTSKQLRQNSGRDKFPVAVKRVKSRGASSEDGDVGVGAGTVYLRCTLTPFVCCDVDEAASTAAAAAAAAVTANEVAAQEMAGVAGWGGGKFVETPNKALSDWATKISCRRKSAIFVFLASAAVILSLLGNLSATTLPAGTENGEVSESKLMSALSESPSPCVCTSVWDLRQPDGTAYPDHQLAAAAAALVAELETENAETKPGGSVANGAHHNADGDATDPSEILAGNRNHGEAGGIGGIGGWARLCAIIFAMLAAGFIAIDRLLGSGMGKETRHEPAASLATMPAPPMQARVHLLEWDGRSMTQEETIAAEEAASSDIEGIYYSPPSGSELSPMPHRFALAESMDMAKAWQRWGVTLAWRKESNVDFLLSKPHPRFSLIKSMYPHCFHLPDKDGRLTYYERPGMFDFDQLEKAGITKQDLVEHYVYCMEYLWRELQPKQSQKLTIVIDLTGVKMRDIVGESMAFLKTTVGIMSRHYPQRSFKILILNAPSFFNLVFGMIKPMLNEATKKKIEVLPPASATHGMLKVIPTESLPPNYGGTCKVPLMESPAEASLLAHVKKMLDKNGQNMEPVS